MSQENNIETEVKHVRRVRYKGTHPKNYKEKYKELNPDKYAADIEKVKRKGKTPAGMHISICVDEIMNFLDIKPGQIGLDCTLGYGGHSRAILERLNGEGHLHATDVDPIESVKTKERLEGYGFGEDMLSIHLLNFAHIDTLGAQGISFDFAMADLGVSSMQIDNPERGFTYKQDGPLDLRLNPHKGISASERLAELDIYELEEMLIENSDEIYAKEISRTIMNMRKKGEHITTTKGFAEAIATALNFLPEKEQKEAIKKACQRCFQALRIDVNNEFEVLYELLENLPKVLNSNGRVAILTFHSGEDRMVKKAFKQGLKEGLYSEIAKDVIRPSGQECFINPRAKSAKLRWAIKA